MMFTYYCNFQYGTVRGLLRALGKPYLTLTFRKLVLVVLNIYNTVRNYNIKKSGTITGTAAILEPQNKTDLTQTDDLSFADLTNSSQDYFALLCDCTLT